MTSSLNTEKPVVREQQRPPFERTALLLQGGGALGSYQAGVYEALTKANLEPDWVAGISIGAVNAALIAGNAPEKRVEQLREFWEAVSTAPLGVPYLKSVEITDELTRRFVNQSRALGVLLFGAPNFFTPRALPPLFWSAGSADSVSYYDVSPLKSTLERLVDFDRINSGRMRFSVGAVNVRTGNFIYFDNKTHRICPAHIIASGSLPPGFPATEIEGEYYWDGGLVSNTPLQWMLDNRPHEDTLAFQVDLWSADGELPDNLQEAEVRQKEIQYSSRTRAATNQFKYAQMLRRAFRKVSRVDRCPGVEWSLLLREERKNRFRKSGSSSVWEHQRSGRGWRGRRNRDRGLQSLWLSRRAQIGRVGADPQGLGHGRRRRQRHIPGRTRSETCRARSSNISRRTSRPIREPYRASAARISRSATRLSNSCVLAAIRTDRFMFAAAFGMVLPAVDDQGAAEIDLGHVRPPSVGRLA